MTERRTKGTFSEHRLKVAGRYVVPGSRRNLLLLGLAAATVVAAVGGLSYLARGPRVLAPGPLSSSHALLLADCAACHTPGGEVSRGSCTTCHEKYGDELGVYSFSSHYLYRTHDFQRVVPSPLETACAACHPEHGGREAVITRVPDEACLRCHEDTSFDHGHPQFAFAREDEADDARLNFAHGSHVKEVMERKGFLDHEKACLACHVPRRDGRGFEAIDFDRSCGACHLGGKVATPRLAIRGPGSPIGVQTLETFRELPAPSRQWAWQMSPREFRRAGERVLKTPLHHRDPWILANLRGLRRFLYQDAGLADLLRVSADVPPRQLRVLYEEAVTGLRSSAEGLRSSPDPQVQEELARVEALLDGVERALENPYTPLDETRFLLALAPRDLPEDQRQEAQELVSAITGPCRQCHQMEAATIVRVQKDQRALWRAEFDHRAHILQRRCLDCHTAIPLWDSLESGEPVEASLDRAEIQNIPRIETCRECHGPAQAASTCVTCHAFHPDPDRRSDLLLYVD